MGEAQAFAPKWASPPGQTIHHALVRRGISLGDFAATMGLTRAEVDDLLSGATPITIELARSLSDHIGSSVNFWMNRDCQYRDDLDRVTTDEWVNALPTKQMSQFGWIPSNISDWRVRARACLDFFGVDSYVDWQQTYGALIAGARFRTSPDETKIDAGAVAAWMRQGERLASEIHCQPWDANQLRTVLGAARKLTREKDPAVFIPELARLCASAGVALAVVPAPPGCMASGVARFVSKDRAQIVLSARWAVDDHFWFTFFHECGHLLLHDSDVVFVDEFDKHGNTNASIEEEDANRFAAEMLVPSLAGELPGRVTYRDVLRIAMTDGVAPGIVVGQLQHEEVLDFSRFNSLKRRYRWNGVSLEKVDR